MKPVFKKIAALVGILILGAVAYGLYVWYQPHRDVRNEHTVTTNADALLSAFKTNEKNAQYLDKAVAVSGEIEEVKTNQQGKTVCYLKTNDPFVIINCTFKETTTLKKGQQVIVKGICTGYLPNAQVVLIDSYIEK